MLLLELVLVVPEAAVDEGVEAATNESTVTTPSFVIASGLTFTLFNSSPSKKPFLFLSFSMTKSVAHFLVLAAISAALGGVLVAGFEAVVLDDEEAVELVDVLLGLLELPEELLLEELKPLDRSLCRESSPERPRQSR